MIPVLRRSFGPALFLLLFLLCLVLGPSTSAQAQPLCDPLPDTSTVRSEVFLLVDGSGSINPTDWALEKNALTELLEDQTLFARDGSIAVGVMQYSTEVDEPDILGVILQASG